MSDPALLGGCRVGQSDQRGGSVLYRYEGELVSHAAEVLERAADYLRVNGHVKGQMYRPSVWPTDESVRPRACALGAIQMTTSYDLAVCFLARKVVYGKGGRSVPITLVSREVARQEVAHWNDHPQTTAEQVIDTMLETAKDIRNGEEL